MSSQRTVNRGYTLIEVLIALVIMGLFVAVVIPSSEPAIEEQLRAAAKVVAADVDYARSLAVTYNSTYRVSFDPSDHRFIIEHSGIDTTLDALPPSPFRASDDPPDQHIVRLDRLAGIDEPVTIASAYADESTPQPALDVEFGALGETTRAAATHVWLATGELDYRRYVELRIDPVTGIATVGSVQFDAPPLTAYFEYLQRLDGIQPLDADPPLGLPVQLN